MSVTQQKDFPAWLESLLLSTRISGPNISSHCRTARHMCNQTCPPRLPNIPCTYNDPGCTNPLTLLMLNGRFCRTARSFMYTAIQCLDYRINLLICTPVPVGSDHHEADYCDLYCLWLKTKQAPTDKNVEKTPWLFIWDSDESVSLPVRRKAAVIQF